MSEDVSDDGAHVSTRPRGALASGVLIRLISGLGLKCLEIRFKPACCTGDEGSGVNAQVSKPKVSFKNVP